MSKDRDRDRERREQRDKDREKDRRSKDDSGKGDLRDRSRDRKDREERSAVKVVDKEKLAAEEAEAERLRAIEREALRKKKEIDNLTKDQRTIFVGQLVAKVNEKQLEEFFETLGPVNDVIMLRDKGTGRHKGFGYVEMAELESIPNCLLLNNVVPNFQKYPILVKASEAEKNFLAKKESSARVSFPYISYQ